MVATPQSNRTPPSQQGVKASLYIVCPKGKGAFPAHQQGQIYYPKPVEKHADSLRFDSIHRQRDFLRATTTNPIFLSQAACIGYIRGIEEGAGRGQGVRNAYVPAFGGRRRASSRSGRSRR